MTTQVTKAALDQTQALVAAWGLPQAWQAIAAAAENQIPTASKEPLLRSIASAQLSQAAATVKADGLTPEVIDLLRQLLELMAGQPAAAQPAEPAPAPAPGMPMEAAASGAASAKADEAAKGLPSPQTDSLSLGQQAKDPPMSREQRKADAEKAGLPSPEDASNLRKPETDTDFRREADAFKADEAAKGLPSPQTDSLRLGEQVKDKPLSTPQRKSARPWWEADDIAPKDPPKPKRYAVPSY